MDDSADYGDLIRSLHAELERVDEPWQPQAYELALARLHQPEDFLDWAKRNHHFSFTMAEVMATVRTRPSELAARLLVAILDQLREERQSIGSAALAP